MTAVYVISAVAYALLTLSVILFEYRRTRRTGVDVMTTFVVVFLLQCCIPAIAIYGTLPLVDPMAPTGNVVFDYLLVSADANTVMAVLGLTAWFVVFFYIGCALAGLSLPQHRENGETGYGTWSATVADTGLFAFLAGGMALTLLSFQLLGESLGERFANLILFRAGFEGIERNTLNANAMALTQSWSWLSVLALFAAYERRRNFILLFVCLTTAILFAILGVSRRAIFLPVLLGYFTLLLHTQRWHFGWILAGAAPLIAWLAFGKEMIAGLATGQPFAMIAGGYDSWAAAVLRAAADAGITVVESLGTLQFLDIAPRFGVDHLLSIAQRFPEGALGWDFDFPERIVRVSTETFSGPDAQDLPPGLLGQMWLDFKAIGPAVWGLVFGFQVGIVQWAYERTRPSLASAAVFVLVVFIVALPLNTGSFDFSFSVDIIAVLAALGLCVRLRNHRPHDDEARAAGLGSRS